jgi:phosphoribosyl-ATP pyrophosphohydrolase
MNKEFGDNFLKELELLVESKSQEHETVSYTSKLVNGGLNKVAQKVGEEATEVVVAALAEDKAALVSESCDLIYHWLCLLKAKNVSLEDIKVEMSARNHSDLDKILP